MESELTLEHALDALFFETTGIELEPVDEVTQPIAPMRIARQFRAVGGDGMPAELPWLRTEEW